MWMIITSDANSLVVAFGAAVVETVGSLRGMLVLPISVLTLQVISLVGFQSKLDSRSAAVVRSNYSFIVAWICIISRCFE